MRHATRRQAPRRTHSNTRQNTRRPDTTAQRNRWVKLAALASNGAISRRPRRVLVDVVGTGRALVTISGGSQPARSGLIGRRDTRTFYVENEAGQVVGRAATYAKAGAVLAAHYGETVTSEQVSVDRER